MNRLSSSLLTLFVLALLFVGAVLLNNALLSGQRSDLTENRVYSLSSGSKQVINDLNEPINLYFFFSNSATKGMVSLRNYATRVQSLLETYEAQSQGKIRLNIIDPQPFSEKEDMAAEFGLTSAQVGALGESVYFGLAGTNGLDDQEIIGFFDPQQEQFLEYEISKLVYQLGDPRLPKVALVTDLPVDGAQNPMTGRFDPAMTFYTSLKQFYDVIVVSATANALPEQTDLVVLAHPKELNPDLRYAIDQNVMQKGKLLAFVDPYFESVAPGMPSESSDVSLLQAWGIDVNNTASLLDPQLGLDIRAPEGGVVRHPGIIGVTNAQLNANDIVSANLDTLNFASVGTVELTDDSRLSVQSIVESSDFATLVDNETLRTQSDPFTLSRLIQGEGSQYTLGARFTGFINSAYSKPNNEQAQHKKNNVSANIIVFADSDMLTDRFWVQQSNFFGQTVFTPFADNGDLVINAVDNLVGSSALISVRSRGTYSRPFTRVEALEVEAQAKFRQQEQRLQQELEQIEIELSQLQNQQAESSSLTLSPEEQTAIDAFMEKRIDIRKSLREVRFELQRDIDALGNTLKIVNIAVAPLLLTLLMMAFVRLVRRDVKVTEKGEIA